MQVSGYDIQQKIYSSFRSIVYKGKRLTDGKKVIIKILNSEFPDPGDVAKLKREHEMLQRLAHLDIVRSYDFIEKENIAAIVMEDLGGSSLANELDNHPDGLQLEDFFFVATRLARIVGKLHLENIIHKDLNPSNIVWNRQTGEIKLIDFGISSMLSQESIRDCGKNQLEGTLAYISPEQTGRINRNVDWRTDIYSLGVTLYELLVGNRPFEAEDAMGFVHAHIAKVPKSPKALDPGIPLVVSQIVQKCMEKTAEARYQSAFGLERDLERCASNYRNFGNIPHFKIGEEDVLDRFRIPEKLYGREKEIGRLTRCFEQIHLVSPRLVLIAGYSGIGKSSVVSELYKPVTREYGFFAKGKFDQLGRTIPYFAFIEAFRQLTRDLLTEDEMTITLWREQLLRVLGPNGKIIANVVPEITHIIGQPEEVEALLPNEEQNRFNLVFQNFLRVFATQNHPLVLFLDDLQWADTASLKLLKSIVSNEENQHLLIVGAYRSNQVDSTHPLSLMIAGLADENVEVENVSIQPLVLEDVEKLVGDTLGEKFAHTRALAEICQEKTGGNPFFLSQFLEALNREGLVYFDDKRRVWECRLDAVRSKKVTDNVVDLMGEKIHRLPPDTRECVRLASCIGDKFELKTLATVLKAKEEKVARQLDAALNEGLIVPLSDTYKYVGQGTAFEVHYQFLHDKVRQAAYALIDDAEKQRFHLSIGRLLRDSMTEAEQEDRIFDIVHHFTVVGADLEGEDEKRSVARLCVIAGERAKHAAAWETAAGYLNVAEELSDESWWTKDYDLMFSICSNGAETLFLCNEKEKAHDNIKRGLSHVKDVFDEIKLNEIHYRSLITTEQRTEGVKLALEVIGKLGVSLPYKTNSIRILSGIIGTKMRLWGKDIDTLRNLPEITDKKLIEAKRQLMIISPAAYLESKELWVMTILWLVKLHVKYGTNRHSAVGFVGWAVLLAGVLGDIEGGYQFAKLAVETADRYEDKQLRTMVTFVVNNFNNHWKEHLRNTLDGFMLSYHTGLEIGDYVYAGHSAANYCYHSLYLGKNLRELEREMTEFGKKMPQFDHRGAFYTLSIFHQTVLNLLGESEDPLWLVGKKYNQHENLEEHRKRGEHPNIWDIHNNRGIIAYLFGDYETADKCFTESLKLEEELVGTHSVAVLYFFASLNKLKRYPKADAREKRQIMRFVQKAQKRMKKWTGHCESNFLHKYTLVEAEVARVLQKDDLAPGLYETAITLADREGFIHEHAIALELAGEYNLEKGYAKIARYYLQDSLYSYKRWGAEAKIAKMREKYKTLLIFAERPQVDVSNLSSTITSSTTAATQTFDSRVALDFDALMKASLTISGEIVFEQLVDNLMEILIENAGAERCFLVMEDNGELFVECSIDIANEVETRTQTRPVSHNQEFLSLAVVLYVYRTLESVVLGDAANDPKFSRDEYIANHRPKSVLGMPILKQGNLVGILYLENNQTTNAFTQEQIEVLNVITAQAAIALENARLYASLKDSKERLELALSEAKESAKIKTEFLSRTSHELRTPLNTIINLPLIMADSFAEIRIARCQKCQTVFEIDADEHITKETNCPECSATELMTEENYHIFEGDTEDLYKRLHKVSKSGENLLAIVDDILDVNHLDTARAQHTQGKVVLHKVLEEIKDVMGEKAEMRGLSFDITRQADDLVFVGNREKIRRILSNLISNAIKFAQQDGLIVIDGGIDRDNVIIAVRDDGPGIPEEHLVKIFDSFHQVQGGTTRQTGGTGLGLTIAQKLVGHHEGHIWAESTVGAGATFYVKLPKNGLRQKPSRIESRVSISPARHSRQSVQ